MPEYRSWSQLSDYEKCPASYRLKRIDKAWSRPAAWLPMGTAVHTGVEAWENSLQTLSLDEVIKIGQEAYTEDINAYLSESPNTRVWASSGPYMGPEDIIRRQGLVTVHLANYIRYYTVTKPTRKPTTYTNEDGAEVPAVELPFAIDLGGVEVRGKIDKIEKDSKTGIIRVVDVKTGADPGSTDQLTVYRVAMEDQYETEITKGSFFMTKRGTPTRDKDLTITSRDEIVNRFGEADTGIREERWDPKVGDHCLRCDVNDSCPFWK